MPAPDPHAVEVTRAPNLHVHAHADKAVIRRTDDSDEREQRFFASVSVLPGSATVLATAAAVTDPGFLAGLREAFGRLLNDRRGPRPTRVWTAVSGLHQAGPQGWSPAQWLADEFRVEVVAPDGPLALVPGGGIFAGSGDHCWRVFRTGTGSTPLVTRYPTPWWEAALPRGTRVLAGSTVEAAPAGLLLQPKPMRTAAQLAVAVPQLAQRPRILLAPGSEVEQVASAVATLPQAVRGSAELVPLGAECDAEWMRRLAGLLGHDVHAATGVVRRDDDGVERVLARTPAGESWQTFAALLRHSATASQVVLAGAPPRGWRPAGPLLYRWGAASRSGAEDVIAKVVPAGLTLIPAAQSGFTGPADQLLFEPGQLTIAIGVPFQRLPQQMPRALAQLLSGLSPQQRARARLLVLGVTDEPTRRQLRTAAANLAPHMEFSGQSTGPSEQDEVAPTTSGGQPGERTDVAGPAGTNPGASEESWRTNLEGAAHAPDSAAKPEHPDGGGKSAAHSGGTDPGSAPGVEPESREAPGTAHSGTNPARQRTGRRPQASAEEHRAPESTATQRTRQIRRPEGLARTQQPDSQSTVRIDRARPRADESRNSPAKQLAHPAGSPPVPAPAAQRGRPEGTSTPGHGQRSGQVPPAPTEPRPERTSEQQRTPAAPEQPPHSVPPPAVGQRPDANPAQSGRAGQPRPSEHQRTAPPPAPEEPVAPSPDSAAGTARATEQRVPPPVPTLRPKTVSSEPDTRPEAESVASQEETGPQVERTDRMRVPAEVATAGQPAGAQDTVKIPRAAVATSPRQDARAEPRVEAEPPRPELVPLGAEAIVAADHASTAEERTSFATTLGSEFEESLPSVNGALARYPVLREAASDAKADFVAVHLYIGSGAHGGTAINRALRGGDAASVRVQAACLVSGLRRLPVHRGASFRTAWTREGRSPLSAYQPGSVLDEPGFLSATAANDLTVEQEHVDVVIWSCSARRTAALGAGLPDEVVFTAASRFKVLAVEENDEAPPAVLLRELRPDDDAESGVLTETDEALLPRLRRALSRRHSADLRPLEDDDQAERLSEPVGLALSRPVGRTVATLPAAPQPVATPQPVAATAP